MKVETMVAMLARVASDPKLLPSTIVALQRTVWGGEIEGPAAAIGVLRDLTIGLDYYEPNPVWRARDKSFFGEETAVDAIRMALTEIARVMGERST